MGRHTHMSNTDGRRARRRTAIVAWGATLALPAAAAFALWSAQGTGGGEAEARNAVALQVAAGNASAQLYPGGTGDVVFSVTNPNPYAVRVTGPTLSTVTGTAGCDVTNFTVNTPTVVATNVPAGGTAVVTATGGLTMKTTALDACQGVVVAVTGTLSGSQV